MYERGSGFDLHGFVCCVIWKTIWMGKQKGGQSEGAQKKRFWRDSIFSCSTRKLLCMVDSFSLRTDEQAQQINFKSVLQNTFSG
jgi:hypothetical protein